MSRWNAVHIYVNVSFAVGQITTVTEQGMSNTRSLIFVL